MKIQNLNRCTRLAICCGMALSFAQMSGSAATLVDRYNFNEPSGTVVTDVVSGKNGTLVNGAYFTGTGAAYLPNAAQPSSDDTGAYITLPQSIIDGYTAITVEAWYTPTHNTVASGDWNRIWDFWNANYHFFFRSGNNTFGIRGDMTTPSGTQAVDGPTVADNTESHIMWTSDPATGIARIYVNGVVVGTTTGFTNTPAMMGVLTNSWLGRSKYAADAYLTAYYNEFRIYSGALNPLEAAASYQSGADTPSTSYGTLNAISVGVPARVLVGSSDQTQVYADASGLTNKAVKVTGLSGLTYASSANGIATVDATGKITGVAPGVATITATFTLNGVTKSASQSVAVVSVPAKLINRYSFDNEMSVDAIDSISGSNGVVQLSGVQSGGQVALDGQLLSYVELPAGLISTNRIGANAVTLESWVTFPSTNQNWANMFAFGNTVDGAGGNYLFFTPHSGNGDYRAIVSSTQPGWSNNGEQGAFVGGNLDYRTNIHVVVVANFGRDQMAIYLNGVLMAQNVAFARELSDIRDTFSYLGRSLYDPDPRAIMNVDEFRIYDGALSAAQIAAAYQTFGPASTNNNPGTFQNIALSAPAQLTRGWQTTINPRGNWQNATNVNLVGNLDLRLSSSDTNVLTVTAAGVVTAVAPGAAVITAQYQGNSSTANITVVDGTATLLHKYSFNETSGDVVKDLVGTADGRIMVGTNTLGATNATWGSGQLTLNTDGSKAATDTYVDLPDHLFSSIGGDFTVEMWVTRFTTDFQARLLDIGSLPGPPFPSEPNIFLNAGGRLDWSLGNIDAGGPATGTKVHVVAVYNDTLNQAKIYTNGVQAVMSAPGAATLAVSSLNDTNVWLGRSLYSAPITPQYYDPYLRGAYDEVRIYSGLMPASQVAANFVAGPDPVTAAPTITFSLSGGNLVLSWAASSPLVPYVSSTLGATANWVQAPGIVQIVGSNKQLSVPVSTTGSQFFRLQQP